MNEKGKKTTITIEEKIDSREILPNYTGNCLKTHERPFSETRGMVRNSREILQSYGLEKLIKIIEKITL